MILDGAQALHKATRAVFGEAALIQRCQVHYADVRIMPMPSITAFEEAALALRKSA